MHHPRKVCLTALILGALIYGCSRQRGPERVPTVPVRGTVLVDGTPAKQLTVRLHAQDERTDEVGIYAAHPSALTAEDGTFVLSTYEHGDGVGAGTYTITFEWLTYDAFRHTFGPPDKLKRKYADPRKSEFTITVTGDEEEPIALESFKLEK